MKIFKTGDRAFNVDGFQEIRKFGIRYIVIKFYGEEVGIDANLYEGTRDEIHDRILYFLTEGYIKDGEGNDYKGNIFELPPKE